MNGGKSLNRKNISDAESQFYEEMLLRYIANKYVEHENECLEKEMNKMENIPDTAINIDKVYKKTKKSDEKNLRKRLWLYKGGSIVAVVLFFLIIITATVPTVRAAVIDFYMKIENTHTDISNYPEDEIITENESQSPGKYTIQLDKEYNITYLPEGFFMTSESKDMAGISKDYYDNGNNCIMFNQMVEESAISIDTENAETSYVDINGTNALMAIKTSEKTINVTWKKDNYFMSVISVGVSEEELLKVVRSIK